MIQKLLVGVVVIVGLSGVAGSAFAYMVFGDSDSPGVFCKVEDPDVCVIAQSEEDCKKLGGEKVDSCPMPEEEDGE